MEFYPITAYRGCLLTEFSLLCENKKFKTEDGDLQEVDKLIKRFSKEVLKMSKTGSFLRQWLHIQLL